MNVSPADIDVILQGQLRAFDDPEWFYNDILKFPALPWQIDATNAVFDVRRPPLERRVNLAGLPRLSIRSCHGPGKTQFLAMLMHIWNFTTPGKIACTAPKEAQLTKRLWPRYRHAMVNADKWYKRNINVKGREIDWGGDPDWGANAETASEPDNLAGYHDKPQLFLVDEAAAKRLDPMFPVIEGALTTKGSCLVEIGNPTRVEGEFYNHHNKKGIKELYYKLHIKQEDAPELVTQEWVDIMIAKYGINSPIVKIRVFGEFAAFDEYILIPISYIEDSLDIEEATDGSIPRLRVSVDVADGGADSTVITVCRHYDTFIQLLKQKQFYFEPSKAPIEAAKAAEEMFEGFGGSVRNGDDIVVDSIGVGSGTAGRLMELGHNVVTYKGGESSDNMSRWRNRRVQSFMALYEAFRDGRIRVSPDAVDDEEEFRAHLLSVKRRVSNERVDDLEPKKMIQQDGLPSPDRADSLAMQYATQTPAYTRNVTSAPILIGQSNLAGYDV